VREAIIDALVALLEASASIKHVSRVNKEETLSAQQLPAVLVVDDADEEIEWKTGGLADVYFTIRLIGVVMERSDMSQAQNELDVAIKSIIGSNPTVSGTAIHATILPLQSKNLADTDSVATFERPVRMFYEGSVTGGL